jgi:deoxyribose-phosphate aldolase
MKMTKVSELAKMIDHSILGPTLTDADLESQCKIALKYNVASVCVKPYAVKRATELLNGTDVKVGCVIGFPHGNSSTAVKVFETEQACNDGATEIDMVINIGKALGGDWDYVEKEIKAVTDTCHKNHAIVKVIFETDFVKRDEDKIRLCQICTKAGADFVKTSTGFGYVKQPDGDYNYTGATVHDIKLMREHSGPGVQVKCAGGVRNLDSLLEMKAAGATRSGATATETMLEEAIRRYGNI